MDISRDIQWDKKSGYNYFDIVWFLLRWRLPTPIQEFIVFPLERTLWQKPYYQHIICPLTWVYHRLLRITPYYYTCEIACHEHKWVQFRQSKCNLCGNVNTKPHFLGFDYRREYEIARVDGTTIYIYRVDSPLKTDITPLDFPSNLL